VEATTRTLNGECEEILGAASLENKKLIHSRARRDDSKEAQNGVHAVNRWRRVNKRA